MRRVKNHDYHIAPLYESLRDVGLQSPKKPKRAAQSNFESTMWFKAVMVLAVLVIMGSLFTPDPNPPTHPYSKYRT